MLLQLPDEPATAQDVGGSSSKGDSYVGSLEDAVLHNAHQFHKWHTELEAACASETEEKYKRYADLLEGHLEACSVLQVKVRLMPPAQDPALLMDVSSNAPAGHCCCLVCHAPNIIV